MMRSPAGIEPVKFSRVLEVRIKAIVTVGALALLSGALMAGCSSGGGSTSSEAPATSTPKVSPIGPFFGECGRVTDDEVATISAQPKFPTVFRNSVGCVWQVDVLGDTPRVSFSWYRGSPIGREASGAGLIGRPTTPIQVQGHPGFRGSETSRICEVGVQYGDDFFHWSVTSGLQDPPTDMCSAAVKLADLTASRLK